MNFEVFRENHNNNANCKKIHSKQWYVVLKVRLRRPSILSKKRDILHDTDEQNVDALAKPELKLNICQGLDNDQLDCREQQLDADTLLVEK
jgi:hypothetical protein